MTNEHDFLNTILANPADRTVKLIYADWLEERDDPRAELLRLRVAVADLPVGTPEGAAARARLAELEAAAPPNWLAMLDGPVWCLAGNIVGERPSGPGGAETRRGTRLFRPNAKVYLSGYCLPHLVLDRPADAYYPVTVIGQHRKSRAWIECHLRPAHVTNWRVHLLRQPGPLRRLRAAEWPGFRLPPGGFTCPSDPASPEAVRALLAAIWPEQLPPPPPRPPGPPFTSR